MTSSTLTVGLTGGIASGKSTVARMFVELGAELIDTDQIARELVVAGSEGLAAVVAAFGRDVLDANGELDRSRMRTLVFADAHKRRELEGILHPRIRAETVRRIDALGEGYAIVAVPLLVESGFDELVDRVLVVDCPERAQRERLQVRDDISADEAEAMIAAQISREQRLAAADDVIDNSADLSALRAQVDALHAKYSDLARNCRETQARAE